MFALGDGYSARRVTSPGLLHMLPPEPGGFLFDIPAGVTCFFTFLLREGRTVWYVPFAWGGEYDRNG